MRLSERQVGLGLAAIGFGCFAVLLTLEIATESDDLSLGDVAGDALTLFIAIGAAVGVAMLWHRNRALPQEKLALIRALKSARGQGE